MNLCNGKQNTNVPDPLRKYSLPTTSAMAVKLATAKKLKAKVYLKLIAQMLSVYFRTIRPQTH
jgi:hypothetical protein